MRSPGAWEGGRGARQGFGEVGLGSVGRGLAGGRAEGLPGACVRCQSRGEDCEERSTGPGTPAGSHRWDLSALPLLQMMSCGAGGGWVLPRRSIPAWLASGCQTLLRRDEARGERFKR